MSTPHQLKETWAKKLQSLVGLRITGVRYMTDGECADLCITKAPVVLELGDSTLLWPMADDEGNDGGALGIQRGRTTVDLPEGAPTIG